MCTCPPDASHPDRRSFLKAIAAGAATGAMLPGAVRAAARAGSGPAIAPLGMLATRLAMSRRRLTGDGTPAYTSEFVLADVVLSPPRRFNEFSGDLSGRYIGALATDASGTTASADAIAPGLLAEQRSDGRFGSDALVFSADAIGPQHMALLWGNGRLLVGLMEYYERRHDPAVLASARRLADFLVAVRQQCADPGVAKRVEGQGAFGFICFTQLIEGLVLTANATGDRRYLETSAEIAPLLPPRGIQHSHGYLSTLRGVMLLHDATKDARWLDFVRSRFDDLVRSRDYTIYGAVLEYFGWESEGVTDAERKPLLAASGDHPRDEGCSSADFVRLSLQLWHATSEPRYLDLAERAIENSLYPNQWDTGDFGSRVTFERGLMPTANAARCWWCCTMHGHRALSDVLASSIVRQGDRILLTLLGEARWSDGKAELAASREIAPDGHIVWHVAAKGLASSDRVIVRVPWWAGMPTVAGTPARADSAAPSSAAREASAALSAAAVAGRTLEIAPGAGGRIASTVSLPPVTWLQFRNGDRKELGSETAAPVEAALFYGPWLLVADEAREPLFFGEPWPENIVRLPRPPRVATGRPSTAGDLTGLALEATYEHGGFPGVQPVTLSLLAALSDGRQRTMAAWLRYR